MGNSKKVFNRILLIVLMLAFIFAGILAFKFLFSGQQLTEMYINRIERLEKKNAEVDLFFAGGSRVYRSFDPDIFDEVLDFQNTTNSGTPAQRPPLTYYLVEDFIERFHPKCIIVGATYNGMQFEQTKSTVSFAMDRLKPLNKFKCLLNLYGYEGLFVSTGKAEYISNMDIDKVKERVEMKTAEYQKKVVLEKETHKSNGFSGRYKGLKQGGITSGYDSEGGVFDEKNIDADTASYYDKIVDVCKKNDVRLIMVTGPCSMYKLFRVENYQGSVDYFNKYAKENGIEYYNLNYIKNRDEILPDTLFKDKIHLNYEGGQRISKIFAQILKDDFAGKDVSHYFYKDLDELKENVHRVVSCFCKATRKGDKVEILLDSFRNKNIVPEYRILSPDGDVIVDWTKSEKFEIPYSKVKGYKKIKAQAKSGIANETYAFTSTKIE